MKFGVVVFPGSNCDDDMIHVIGNVLGFEVEKLWHKEHSLGSLGDDDCVILPGGFSYGDYLRCGAIARFSPVMQEVIAHANRGGLVFGICNGFQILCEAGLLPGVLLRNQNQKFICKNIHIRTETKNSPVTCDLSPGQVLKIPIAHAEGRYHISAEGLKELEQNDQILFRYTDAEGHASDESNVNGALQNIAGICNLRRNVCGMMPHPERSSESMLGNDDGYAIMRSIVDFAMSRDAALVS